MSGIPTLETERLILRGQRPEDSGALIAAYGDGDFIKKQSFARHGAA